MKTVKLNELVDIYLGLTHTPEYVLQGVPFLSVKDISNGNIDFSKCSYITEEEYNSLPNGAKPQIGDMLFCRVGTIGKPVIIEPNTPKFGSFVSLGYFRLKKNDLCRLKYLYYWMYSDSFFSQVKKNVKGASQVNLNTGWLSKFEIPLYSIEEQEDIISKLEHLDDLISTRKLQLERLDLLVKSRFVELFIGKGYPTKTVDEVSLGKGEYGAQSASVEYDPTRPRYVRITDINDDGTLNDDVVASINPTDDEQYKLEYGDFMFARMGATVGKTYAFIEGNQIFAGYLIRYRLNQELINPRYLFWYTRLDEYWNWVKLNQSGAAQPGINAKKYGSLQIPLPSIEKQNEFAAFVEQTDKSKLAVQQSLEKLEMLKKALMQKYFG